MLRNTPVFRVFESAQGVATNHAFVITKIMFTQEIALGMEWLQVWRPCETVVIGRDRDPPIGCIGKQRTPTPTAVGPVGSSAASFSGGLEIDSDDL